MDVASYFEMGVPLTHFIPMSSAGNLADALGLGSAKELKEPKPQEVLKL